MKAKLLLIEAFAVVKIVLCWIVALPVLALSLSAVTIWDKAALALLRARRGQGETRFQPGRVNAGA
jgi:hypothetical protein